MEPIAHSGRASRGIRPQPYVEHIGNVRRRALCNIEAALCYRATPEPLLRSGVEWASAFHDLGKLEEENQRVLASSETGKLRNHVDAGVAHLLQVRQPDAALAVYSHHIGLPSLPDEAAKQQRSRQDPSQAECRDPDLKLITDANLSRLLSIHREVTGPDPPETSAAGNFRKGLDRRLVLSCLVDADHSDTARNYGEEPGREPAGCRWDERLEALDKYVAKLAAKKGGSRTALRSRVYETCRGADTSYAFYACDSPVGSGKTTAIMAYLLRAAIDCKFRRIFVVLPYTNIIRQAVDVYREALVLPVEDPERVVAAHHHQSEFETPELRYLTTLWESPIIVTTAVQFFETLAACATPKLRKLHQLPGSAVFIDEAHAAMPIHLWPYMWSQLKALASDWSCRFVLGSGSLAKFWEKDRIMGGKTETLPPMIPDDLRADSAGAEGMRVRYKSRAGAFDLAGLCDWIQEREHAGSRLVVLNTVQSAATVALELRGRGVDTLHLSTALAPVHRNAILDRVRKRLQERDSNWVLVATSCVEAGVDLSFRTAFRERARATSIVQIGGRVNRHAEWGSGTVWDFIVSDPQLTLHPDFKHGREVVEQLFQKNMWDGDLTQLMTYALNEEFKRYSQEGKIKELADCESAGQYPDVARLARLIQSDTRLVVIDRALAERVRKRLPIRQTELLAHSVQLWFTKIQKHALQNIGIKTEIFEWAYDYDWEFLGVMAGILKMEAVDRAGFAII